MTAPTAQADDDWYEIYIDLGEERLLVTLLFFHKEGNINLAVYNSSGVYFTGSSSFTNNEYIDIIVPSNGTYYLLVHFNDAGNTYDLRWQSVAVGSNDDNYEENDDYTSAYDLSSVEGTWLSSINGVGIQADDDWYEVSVTQGEERLVVDLLFTDADGDINIEVYNSTLSYITGSSSVTDDEHIDTLVPQNGTYYLLVYFADAGNVYDLRWNDLTSSTSDDNYEENDIYTSAFDLSSYESMWLSSIDGLGIQADDDWYEISIIPGQQRLLIDLVFTNADGDIDIEVYDSSLMYIVGSSSVTDDEHIDVIVPSGGTYYLLVYFTDAGNTYDLRWNDAPGAIIDDTYEENDDYSSAYDLSSYQATWLSSIDGLGIQADDDWYGISIQSGFENVIINLTFTHSNGNINLGLYDTSGSLIISNASLTDNEDLSYVVSSSGIYYIRVYESDVGNVYDLMWETKEVQPSEEIPGYDLLFLFGSVLGVVSIIFIKWKRNKL